MRRPPKPVVLPLRPAPEQVQELHARCPRCDGEEAGVLGVIALRLVYRCPRCRVMFYAARDFASFSVR
jgi:ribosomal protein S27AE